MQMMKLRKSVLDANLEIVKRGLALHTFGNASGIERGATPREGVVAIKPSGVPYETLTPEDIVLTDLEGNVLDGALRPSSDLDTHLLLYREFPDIGGIVHTHSEFATAWAQACKAIPVFGTTHADYFHGPIPITESLTKQEVNDGYVLNTGRVIVRCFREGGLNPTAMPAVLVAGHAPFAWGATPAKAVEHADILEFVARLAYRTVALEGPSEGIPLHVRDHHYFRKHGAKATYGQK